MKRPRLLVARPGANWFLTAFYFTIHPLTTEFSAILTACLCSKSTSSTSGRMLLSTVSSAVNLETTRYLPSGDQMGTTELSPPGMPRSVISPLSMSRMARLFGHGLEKHKKWTQDLYKLFSELLSGTKEVFPIERAVRLRDGKSDQQNAG